MADRPLDGATPRYPNFATADVQESPENGGHWNVQTPSPEVQASGWRRLERPPRYWLNWLHRLYNQWIQWFDQEVELLKTTVGTLVSGLASLVSNFTNHTHNGVNSLQIAANSLSGVSVGDFVMTFTGFTVDNFPVRAAYRLLTNEWTGTDLSSNPVVELRIMNVDGTADPVITTFKNGQKMVLSVSGNLTAGSSTVITVGGESTASIPFNTDHATTMNDIITAINNLSVVYDARLGSTAFSIDIIRTNGDVASSSGTTTGGTAVTWSLAAVDTTLPVAIRPDFAVFGSLRFPIKIVNGGNVGIGIIQITSGGDYYIDHQSDGANIFSGSWETSGSKGFETQIIKYNLVN